MGNIIIKKSGIDLSANSKIKEIIIYSNKAVITRYQSVKLNKGINTVTFSNLGANIEEHFIKASLSVKEAMITSTSLQQNSLYFFKEEEHEEVYNDLIKNLKKAVELVDIKSINALENIILNDLKEYIKETLNNILLEKDISISKLKESLDFVSEKLKENSLSINNINTDIYKINEILSIQKDKLERIRDLDQRIQNNIEVSLESEMITDSVVEITYSLPDVSWKASYDVSLYTASKEVDFTYYGEINQKTGEDWNEAKIILSSSENAHSIEIPRIYPVTLSGFFQKREKELELEEKVTKQLDEKIINEAILNGDKFGEETEAVCVENKDIYYKFVIKNSYSIPSDNNWHKITISEFKFEPKLFYETVPEYLEYIYLKGEFKNNSSYPFLQGKVLVFRNGSFMGRTNLKYVSSGESFSISFGIDEDLKVKRIEHINRYSPAKGLSNKNEREWEYHFILFNYKEKEEKIILKEAIYLSELKEVSIKIHENTTEKYNKNSDAIISWEIDLPQKRFEYKKVVLHYSLISKKEFDISNF